MKNLRVAPEKIGDMIKETVENPDKFTVGCCDHSFYIKRFPQGELLVFAEKRADGKMYVKCADWLEVNS
jgi:hypothetical protein